MVDSKDKDLLVEIAVMYYLENKTQSQISKELFMSRPKVSRLLKKAREMNIVDIKINYESDDLNRVKKQIQHRFSIDNVVIVKTLNSKEETIREIGKAAANEMKYKITDNSTIGMSWGRTVKAMVDAFKPKELSGVKIVELFGAVDYNSDNRELLSIGYEFSKKLNGIYYPLPSPLYINDKKTRDILLENPIIKGTLEMIESVDFMVTSLGVVNSDMPQQIWDAHVDKQTRQELIDEDAQGYLCAHFFNRNGEFIKHSINNNIIGIKTENILKKKIMLVAGGVEKCKAIYSIIKGGYINTLVSDDQTLKKILKEDIRIRGDFL